VALITPTLQHRQLQRMPNLVYSPHPLLAAADRKLVFVPFIGGETLSEYLERAEVHPKSIPAILTLNGIPVPCESWNTVYPREDDLITLRLVVSGGGGRGSNPVAVVASIALMIVAPQIAAGVLGSQFGATAFTIGSTAVTFGTIGTAVINVVGGLLISTLLPAPRPQLSQAGGGAANPETSSTYSLTGGQNRARFFEPLPLVMGIHRFFPDLGAKPYNGFIGEDQYLYQILHFGMQTDLDLSDYRIGTTSISAFAGVTRQDPGRVAAVKTGTGNGVITIRTGFGVQMGDYTITYNGSNLWTVRDPLGTQVGSNYTTGNNFDNQISFRITNGTIAWVAGAVWTCTVTNTDGALTLMHSNVDTLAGTDLTYNTAFTRTTSQDATAFEVDIVGSLFSVDATSGELSNQPVRIDMEYSVSGAGVWHPIVGALTYVEINSASRTPVRKTYRVSGLPGTSAYDVRLKKLYTDGTGPTYYSTFSWTQLRTFQADTTSYAGQRRLGIRVKASGQLQGALAALNVLVSAKCEVWTGGSWVPNQISQNPAWWFRWFALGKTDTSGRILYGGGLTDAKLDLDAIKSWGSYCSDNSLTVSVVIDQQMSVGEALSLIARCGRATVSRATGKLGVVWDAANLPVTAIYGPANIRAGSFHVEYTTENLADEIAVSFTNPDLDWQRDIVRAKVPGVTNPVSTTNVDFMGCTNKDQAGKEANLLAANQYYRRRRVAFETDLEGFVSMKGDVVALSHDLTTWDYGGRVVTFNSTGQMKLDRAVPRSGLSDYITIRSPNGTLNTYLCNADTGTTDIINLQGTLNDWPSPFPADGREWVYQFGPRITPGKKVKIIGIEPLDEHYLRIISTDEETGYYDYEGNPYDYTTPVTFAAAPTVTSIKVTEQLVMKTPQLTKCTITWEMRNAFLAAVKVSVNGGPQLNVPVAGSTSSTDFEAYDGQVLDIEVTPLGAIKGISLTIQHIVVGRAAAPANVTGLTASLFQNGQRLAWNRVTDLDFSNYEVRRGASWALGTPIYSGSSNSVVLTEALAGGTHNYWARAKDLSGNYSVGDATSSLNVVTPGTIGFTWVISGQNVVLSWSVSEGSFTTDHYELRYGASWASGTLIASTKGTSYSVFANWNGSRTFWVAATDWAGNTGSAASTGAVVNAPSAPTLQTAIVGDHAVFSWNTPASDVPVIHYHIRYGASFEAGVNVGDVDTTTLQYKVDWSGSRQWWVAAHNTAGFHGTAGGLQVTVTVPGAVIITPQVIDNFVLLRWTDGTQTLPVLQYEIRKGVTWAGGTLIGRIDSRFATVFEEAAGSYTYWIAGIDSANNEGTPSSVTVQVSQPPDFVLYADNYDDGSGARTNVWITPLNKFHACIDEVETWAGHFTARTWNTIQDQIDAGYPNYFMPSLTTGSYVREWDLGAVVASTQITVNLTSAILFGTVTVTPKISVRKLATDPWTDFPGVWTAYATDFRYVKVTLDFASVGGDDLIEMTVLNMKINVKLRNDAGVATADSADTGGTVVNFNVAFLDVQSITVTPLSTTAAHATYDFTDVPNPTSFKVFVWDAAGGRITKDVSWSAKGV